MPGHWIRFGPNSVKQIPEEMNYSDLDTMPLLPPIQNPRYRGNGRPVLSVSTKGSVSRRGAWPERKHAFDYRQQQDLPRKTGLNGPKRDSVKEHNFTA